MPKLGFAAGLLLMLSTTIAVADDQPRLKVTDPVAQDRTFQTKDGPVRVISFRGSSNSGLIYIHGDQEPIKSVFESEQINAEMIKNVISYVKHLASSSHASTYFVIRPGMFGEIGSYSDKQSRTHYLALAETVHQIGDADRLKHIVLVGQSGGAMAGMATLILSPDRRVKCGVFQSGSYHTNIRTAFDLKTKFGNLNAIDFKPSLWDLRPVVPEMEKSYNLYDISAHLRDLHLERRVDIDLISDPRDQIVPFVSSDLLAKQLKSMGVHAELIKAKLPEPPYHKMMIQTFKIGTDCLKG